MSTSGEHDQLTGTATGDPRIDAALRPLEELDDLDLTAQLTAFSEVHGLLAAALDIADSIEDAPVRPQQTIGATTP